MRTIIAMLLCWSVASVVAALALGRFLRWCDETPRPADDDGQEAES